MKPNGKDINVFVGVDVGKGNHYAQVITAAGDEVFDRQVPNDENAITELIGDASKHGRVVFVVDQPLRQRSLT